MFKKSAKQYLDLTMTTPKKKNMVQRINEVQKNDHGFVILVKGNMRQQRIKED